jgi:hypothetical protein
MPVRPAVRQSLLLVVLLIASLTASALPAQAHEGATRWECIAHYESSHRWHINTGNGHYGGLQFSLSTWRYYGGPNYSNNQYPHRATRLEQIVVGKRVAWTGWAGRAPQGGRNAWPNTWPRCN